MKRPSELSHPELVELVTQIQRVFFCREWSGRDSFVEFFDRGKEFDVAMLDDIAIELHSCELAPSMDSTSLGWPHVTLYVCDDCSTAWEPAALRTRGDAHAADAPAENNTVADAGSCPRCGSDCHAAVVRDLMHGAAPRRHGRA